MAVQIDKIKLLSELLYIDNKEGNVVPFRPNRLQSYFLKNKSNRNIVLKHRQGGCSSIILADMFTDCMLFSHTSCAVISHETRATQRLLDRVHFFYETMQLPKPEVGAESRSELTFPELHSSIYIGTSGSRAFGRGDTIRKALLSEMSYYEDGEKVLTGVEDAVPLSGELTIECTPNGEDNIFYDRWVKAREGKSPYKPFFFPWWWTDDFSIPDNSPLALPEDRGGLSYTGEEIELVQKHHLTESQIRWRRWKIAEKGGLFWQEYPEDELSCFITIGDPVFDSYILNNLAQSCYEGERHRQGWIFWIPPKDKETYWIGADTSAGAPTGSYSAACVLNSKWEVCATFQARIEPHILASILKQLGSWYNHGELIIERNFTGYAVLGHLTDYGNIYHQRDFLTGKVTSNLGWWTNDQTKQYMMTKMKDNLPHLRIWDVNLIRQLRSFRYIKYKPEAQSFDDLAMSLMLAVSGRAVSGGARGFQGAVPAWTGGAWG